MPVEYFLRYKGQLYDVGTRLRVKHYGVESEGCIEWISHNSIYVRLTDGTGLDLIKTWGLDNTIIEIIDPVYYVEQPQKKVYGGPLPSYDSIFVGWVWYIAIMLVGVIFKGRLLIWVFATLVFFAWKNGFFNGGTK